MAVNAAREPRGLSHGRTSFVGRSDAVNKVAGLLTQYRLVTVTGPGGPVADALAAHLAQRQLLLVLDNSEHLLDAVARFCATILLSADDRAAPGPWPAAWTP